MSEANAELDQLDLGQNELGLEFFFFKLEKKKKDCCRSLLIYYFLDQNTVAAVQSNNTVDAKICSPKSYSSILYSVSSCSEGIKNRKDKGSQQFLAIT